MFLTPSEGKRKTHICGSGTAANVFANKEEAVKSFYTETVFIILNRSAEVDAWPQAEAT